MDGFAYIETERLNIVPFQEVHLTERYLGWLNDPDVVKFSEQRHRRHTLESCRTYCLAMGSLGNLFMAICDKRTGVHIGNSTVSIDSNNQIADIQILIGDRSFWGRGLGAEAFSALVEALLEIGCFRKITAGTLAENEAMLKTIKKAGMVIECIRKDHYLLNGKPVDVVYGAKWNDRTAL